MRTAHGAKFYEIGRKAFHMMIELANVPAPTEHDRLNIEDGYTIARREWTQQNPKKGGTMRRHTPS
jgi:hypothetical protein